MISRRTNIMTVQKHSEKEQHPNRCGCNTGLTADSQDDKKIERKHDINKDWQNNMKKEQSAVRKNERERKDSKKERTTEKHIR